MKKPVVGRSMKKNLDKAFACEALACTMSAASRSSMRSSLHLVMLLLVCVALYVAACAFICCMSQPALC